jgi:hypothetical protein
MSFRSLQILVWERLYLSSSKSFCMVKGVPLQARCGPEGSRRFRLPHFHDIRHLKLARLSPSRTGRLYPKECSLYSFLLGAESTPGPWYGRKERCHWKIQWHHRESIPGPPTSSAAPYPLRYSRPLFVWWNTENTVSFLGVLKLVMILESIMY